MNVLNIFVASSYHDAWNSVRPEAEIFIGLAQRGHTVTIATQGDSPYCDRFQRAGIDIVDVYPKAKICIRTIATYRKILKGKGCQIAYGMNSRTIPNLIIAAIGLPIKVVTYRGTSKGLYRHDPFAYLTHLSPRVDAICCNAKAVENAVRRQVWKKNIPICTVYKGQDVSWYQSSPIAPSLLGIPEDAFIIACVANARPSKGLDILIRAAQLVLKNADAYLVIVGKNVPDAPYSLLKKQSKNAGRIILLGHRDDAPRIIAAASIYVQPSVSGEGLAKTVPEAMAQGVPTIVTTSGGLAELVIDGSTGWVVNAGSVTALQDALEKAYQCRSELAAMGKKAKCHLINQFSIQQSVLGHERLFSNLIAGKCQDA